MRLVRATEVHSGVRHLTDIKWIKVPDRVPKKNPYGGLDQLQYLWMVPTEL